MTYYMKKDIIICLYDSMPFSKHDLKMNMDEESEKLTQQNLMQYDIQCA